MVDSNYMGLYVDGPMYNRPLGTMIDFTFLFCTNIILDAMSLKHS